MLTSITAPRNLFSIIAISYLRRNTWSELEVAPFSGSYSDSEPAFTPDGQSLFFASKRPKEHRKGVDWDIWQVSYIDGKCGEPTNPGAPVNSSGNEFYPSIADNGNLYFTATRQDSLGKEDLYRAIATEGKYSSVENVGAPVNSPAFEFNAFIAPDESYRIFGSQGRNDEVGGGDLYISFRIDGKFEAPGLLSNQINTTRLDYCPTVFAQRLYFTSERVVDRSLSTIEQLAHRYESPGNGLGDIYRVDFDKILNEDPE